MDARKEAFRWPWLVPERSDSRPVLKLKALLLTKLAQVTPSSETNHGSDH